MANLVDSALFHARRSRDVAEYRHDTREQLSDERREALQYAAERDRQQMQRDLEMDRLKAEFCQANQDAQRQMLQNQIPGQGPIESGLRL